MEKKPLSSRSAQRNIKRMGQLAGIENLTPHILRHTFAKSLIDQGVSLEKIATLLGHSNLNTTRIYIAPNQQDLQKAVDILVE
jgi:integrase/recombinase XerC